MAELSRYVTGIAVFVVLMNVVTLVMPKGGTARYARLVMAAMLTAMMIAPLQAALAALSGGSAMALFMGGWDADAAMEAARVEDGRRAEISARYKNELEKALAALFQAGGEYELVSCRFDVDEGEEAFGRINGVDVCIRQKAAAQPPLIAIDKPKVRVSLYDEPPEDERDAAREARQAVAAYFGVAEVLVAVTIQ